MQGPEPPPCAEKQKAEAQNLASLRHFIDAEWAGLLPAWEGMGKFYERHPEARDSLTSGRDKRGGHMRAVIEGAAGAAAGLRWVHHGRGFVTTATDDAAIAAIHARLSARAATKASEATVVFDDSKVA